MLRSAPNALAAARAALRARTSEVRGLGSGRAAAALVVGGDCCQQRFCESFLQTLGLKVDLAANAEDGITAAARAPYGLVIVDARARGFDTDLWTQVLQATASRYGATAPDVYVVVEDEAQWQGTADCRAMQHPVRAVNLVRAIERLSR
jgi:DNA-binding NtrC family response regulator